DPQRGTGDSPDAERISGSAGRPARRYAAVQQKDPVRVGRRAFLRRATMSSDARWQSAARSRRRFMISTAAAIGGGMVWRPDLDAQNATERPGGPPPAGDFGEVPAAIRNLKPMTAGIVPISDAERRARLEKARRLMRERQIGAIVLEPGSSLFYYTGVRWGLSERPFVAVIPANGELAWICPAFEEARAREL